MLAGCGEDEIQQPADEAYFPLRRGFYQVYSVTGTNYISIDQAETFDYQLKMEVVDSFVNQEGGYTYTIHRSRRNSANDPWEFWQVWSVRATPSSLIVSEENVPYVRLAFPIEVNRTWNGNAFNTLSADTYTLTTIGKSYTLEGGEQVGPYVQVVQEDSGDPITFMDKRQDFYVYDIGLVKREVTDIVYCSDADECDPGTQVIVSGIVYVQTLIDYGQN